jgi:molybdopterin/thiamine biosynthesis adenylyltransferase
MDNIRQYLFDLANDGMVSSTAQFAAAARFDLTFAEVEQVILESGLCPARYQRNRRTITCEDQLALLLSSVAVVGCGGLGGYIVEQLARIGVGRIIAVDPDVFEEHNLNRQLLANMGNIGLPKVAAAARRVAEINPAVSVLPLQTSFCAANGHELFKGATVVVDALDNLGSRFELAAVCRDLALPLVHGAIAGWYGQISTQRPGEDISHHFSGPGAGHKGVETQLGNPAFTPATVASLQVAEVCKVILGRGETISGRLLIFNLLDMEFDAIPI